MRILVINSAFEVVNSAPRSSEIEIEELVRYAQINIPMEYLSIIRKETELEISVAKIKFLRLWGAKGCIEMNESYHIQQYIPNSLAIGDDECCNALLYAEGEKGFGLYIVSLSDLEENAMVYIADSLKTFLVDGIGLNVFNSYV